MRKKEEAKTHFNIWSSFTRKECFLNENLLVVDQYNKILILNGSMGWESKKFFCGGIVQRYSFVIFGRLTKKEARKKLQNAFWNINKFLR